MKEKRAVITGITGQDGSYLAELLHAKGYAIVGITTGASDRANVQAIENEIEWVTGDVTDEAFVQSIVSRYMPDELYNLASVATVAAPWEDVEGTIASTGLAPLYFLESIRRSSPRTRFFQATSAQMFGDSTQVPQNEDTLHAPRNPYGAGKSLAHNLVRAYRESHHLFATSGILYNHESSRRPESFITRKVTSALARQASGSTEALRVGNLASVRDWGYAKEYVEAMWMMLQQDTPKDYVIATGETHTVRELIEAAAQALSLSITWSGEAEQEVGKNERGDIVVEVDPAFYRPKEAHASVGDPTRIKRDLGWAPRVSFRELITLMAESDKKRYVESTGSI